MPDRMWTYVDAFLMSLSDHAWVILICSAGFHLGVELASENYFRAMICVASALISFAYLDNEEKKDGKPGTV